MQAALMGWSIIGIDLIGHDAIGFERAKAMRETSRDEQLFTAIGGQFDRDMLKKGWATAPQVDRDIEYPSALNRNELGLGVGRSLKMQTANGVYRFRMRPVILNEIDIDADFPICELTVCLRKAPPIITERTWRDDRQPGYFCGGYLHYVT